MKITMKEVSKDNWYECTKVDVTVEQQENFPCSVVYWLAESKFLPHFNPMGIYDGDKLVGFLVYGLDTDDNQYWLMAFMIDKHYQRQGYGRGAMHEFVRFMRETHGCTQIKLGHRPENKIAESLYQSLGFEELGLWGHEVVRKLDLQ